MAETGTLPRCGSGGGGKESQVLDYRQSHALTVADHVDQAEGSQARVRARAIEMREEKALPVAHVCGRGAT
jgi:hypothetical protein